MWGWIGNSDATLEAAYAWRAKCVEQGCQMRAGPVEPEQWDLPEQLAHLPDRAVVRSQRQESELIERRLRRV
jgi:hypothetical protein